MIWRTIAPTLLGIGLVSALINSLMLTGPLFMLQVYDRVLASGSVQTLIVIGGLAFCLYLFFGLFEGLRGFILVRMGQRIDIKLSAIAFEMSTWLPVLVGPQAAKLHPVQDLDTIRQFFSGQGPATFFDLPWMPFYLGIVFLFHPLLGFVALGGALLICVLIGLNEALSRKPASDSAKEAGCRASAVETGRRNSEAIRAMGMMDALVKRWESSNGRYLVKSGRAADISGVFGTTIKTFRFLLQSLILGVGAWLAIKQEITPGVMIAASILTSRALAPVEQAVSQWRGFIAARQSLKRLKLVIEKRPDNRDLIDLPLPAENLSLDNVACGPAGINKVFVQNVSFKLLAGEGLGIIGPSGSGKSTLARAIVGVNPTLRGCVRYDGAELEQWPLDVTGKFIGYLPQNIQLFDGTVAENISRFIDDAPAETIISAAKLSDIHETIVGLPDGYNTVIGSGGIILSGGLQQRLALARAVYGQPYLIVLDEPNSNLDSDGESALANAIIEMKKLGSIVIVIAHRPSAISAVDKILVMKGGQISALGPKEEVLANTLATVPNRSLA